MNENINDFVEKYEDFNKTIMKQDEGRKFPIFNKRFREYNPDQILFYTFNPGETFPEGSFERFVVDIIKNIDIADFAKRTTYDLGGPDEYNPRSMLAIIFYGESEGIFSSRNLSKLCVSDQRYIYVSGNETPEHSTISRFLNEYGKEIEEIFIKVLYIADNQGYIEYEKFVTDGSKFKANASRKFTGTVEDFRKREKTLKEKISLAVEKQKQTDKEEEKAYWKNKEERYKEDMEKIGDFLKDAKPMYNALNEEMKQNITDRDCRVMRMNNSGYSEGYNAQITTCEKNGIIISSEVTNNGNDKGLLQDMIEKTEKNIPEGKKAKAREGAYIFDAGYNTVDNLIYCEKNSINAYIADEQDKKIYYEKTEDYSKKKKIGSRDCKIELINDEVKVSCPGGENLILLAKRKDKDKYNYFYKIENQTGCEKCKYKTKCIKEEDKPKIFSIRNTIIDNYKTVKAMHDKIRTDQGRMIYSRRMPTVEKIFGHIKKNLRFERFAVIGLKKVRTRWTIICLVYNLKRIYNLGVQSN